MPMTPTDARLAEIDWATRLLRATLAQAARLRRLAALQFGGGYPDDGRLEAAEREARAVLNALAVERVRLAAEVGGAGPACEMR
jgi:hypothetical protein